MQLPLMTKNLVLGCLLGGGLGDAWGGTYEGVASPVVFEVPSRPALSDDTQLTLATCQSIIEFGRVDPENLASFGSFGSVVPGSELFGGHHRWIAGLGRSRPD